MTRRVAVGVGVILMGTAMLVPSKALAVPKSIVNKVYCTCKCHGMGEDGKPFTVGKTFRAPGDNGLECTRYDQTACRTQSGAGKLFDCESLVESAGGATRVAPSDQTLAPEPSTGAPSKRQAPSGRTLKPAR